MKVYVVSWSGSADIVAESEDDAIQQAKEFIAWGATSTFKVELLKIRRKE